jgi:hypothetical protein
MEYRHTTNTKLTTVVGILMLCAALVGTVGASGRHHRSARHASVHISSVRQSNRIVQANTNAFNVVGMGGSATATCSPTSGNNSATATGAGGIAAAANVTLCNLTGTPMATGGAGTAANTAAVTQTAANTANATSTNSP